SNTFTVKNYLTVFTHLLKMKYEMGYFKDVYELGNKYFKEFEKDLNIVEAEKLFELVCLAAIELKQFEKAYQFYTLRKNVLPITKRYLAELNLIEFKKKTHQSYLVEIESLIQDVIPDDIKLKLSKELLELYLERNDGPKALALIESMKRLDPQHSYVPNYLKVLVKLGNIDEAKAVALQYKSNPKYEMDAFLVLLKIYIDEKDFHRATILDADYAYKLDTMDQEYQIEAYTLLVDLYTKLNNKLSIDLYQKKLKALKKVESKAKLQEEKLVVSNEVKIEETFEIKAPFKQSKSAVNFEQINAIIELMAFSHQITETKQLRDFLRSFFMKVEEFVTVK